MKTVGSRCELVLYKDVGHAFFAKPPLKYLKISKVELKESATLIRVRGHNSPFTVPRPPEVGYTWAGILHLKGLPWMLYEYSETKLKDTKRKV